MSENIDKRNIFGIDTIVTGFYQPSKHKNIYKTWINMLYRCYSPKFHTRQPSYTGCTVCEEWLVFQNYAEFYIKDIYREQGWHLDKDILYKNNKIYSPKTCVFVPPEINKLFVRRNLQRGDYPIGVHLDQARNRYKASMHNSTGKTKFLGRYHNAQEAFEAYKKAKEILIRELAEKYKRRISPRLYEAMINYRIEITD